MGHDSLFMTGASGFLGKKILRHYLQRPLTIHLLVQEKFVVALDTFLDHEYAMSPYAAKVHLYAGDITKPGLGLVVDDSETIRNHTTMALHLAAAYDLKLLRDVGWRANVMGTQNVLDFLVTLPFLKRLGYLSTTAISGTHRGFYAEDDFDVGQQFKNFYEETKFEAEKCVRQFMSRLPTTIFRPTIIVGDSQTGEIEKIDGPYYGLLMIARHLHVVMQRAPGVACHIAPVDFVARAIVALMEHAEAAGQTVHIADPEPLSYDAFFDLVLKRWGTFRPWFYLNPRWLLPFFSLPGFARLAGVPRASFLYTMTPVIYGTTRMERLLADNSIVCPRVVDYIDALIAYFRQHHRQVIQSQRW